MKVKTDLDADNNKVKNLATPTADTDAATKKYVDDNAGGGGGGATETVSPLLLIGA